jgi:YHYH protein
LLIVAACGSPAPSESRSSASPTAAASASSSATGLDGGTPSSTTDQSIGLPRTTLDLTALPLGNQKFSTSAPAAGSVYLCHAMQGGPPVHAKPWVNTSAGTWNLKAKVAVAGDVAHNAQFSATHSGSSQVLTGNGLPSHSGVFPVASTDPADAYDPDPNSIATDSINVTLPYDPQAAATPACVGGVVGVMSDGIPMFNAFDAGGNDAGAMEVQDTCHGHPNQIGYHYHALSPCMLSGSALTTTTQVGWAFDGYGMYVEYDSSGNLLTDASLDACQGRTSVVPWHGELLSMYHYDLTIEFPYSVACYHGTPISAAASGGLIGP